MWIYLFCFFISSPLSFTWLTKQTGRLFGGSKGPVIPALWQLNVSSWAGIRLQFVFVFVFILPTLWQLNCSSWARIRLQFVFEMGGKSTKHDKEVILWITVESRNLELIWTQVEFIQDTATSLGLSADFLESKVFTFVEYRFRVELDFVFHKNNQ